MVLMEDESHAREHIMLSAPCDAAIIEVMNVERVCAIRFLIWLGRELSCRYAVDMWGVWCDAVIPTCMSGVLSDTAAFIRHDAWKLNTIK